VCFGLGGLRFREERFVGVWGLGFWVSVLTFWVLGEGLWVSIAGLRVEGSGPSVLGFGVSACSLAFERGDLRALPLLLRILEHPRLQKEKILIEVMISDRNVKRGLEMKDQRDLHDLTIHDVKPVSDE
jgi:hypothetical protein